MFEWLDQLISQGTDLTRNAIVLIAIVTVAITYWKTRSLPATLGIILLGFVVNFGVSEAGINTFQDKLEQDVQVVEQ